MRIKPVNSIPYADDHTNGIAAHLKTDYRVDDIVSTGYVSIDCQPPEQDQNKHPKFLFGVGNANYEYYISTAKTTTQPKYFLFDFKKYSLALTGISIKTNTVDWYNEYIIEGSYDNFKTDTRRIIHFQENSIFDWQHSSFRQMKPSRFINISVTGEASDHRTNFAIFGIEFFGHIYETNRDIVCMFCTCKSNTYFGLSYLISLQISLFVK